MINQTINQIVVETQSTLMQNAPTWNSREEYAMYVEYEQVVAEQIRELNSLLENALISGADSETLKRIAIQVVMNW